jgi:hypothetical protein
MSRFDETSPQDQQAARATARLLISAVAASEHQPRDGSVSRAELWAYANRAVGEPVSFAVERAVRADATTATAYRKMLSMKTFGMSALAAAAYDNSATHRRLGDFTLDVVEEEGAPPALVIERLTDGVQTPVLIEAVSIEGIVRIALPAEVDRHIIMDLPSHDHERDLLRLLLANPMTGVYLL